MVEVLGIVGFLLICVGAAFCQEFVTVELWRRRVYPTIAFALTAITIVTGSWMGQFWTMLWPVYLAVACLWVFVGLERSGFSGVSDGFPF